MKKIFSRSSYLHSPFFILGSLCLMLTLSAWAWALFLGLEDCAYCFWQRVALGSVGFSLILLSQTLSQWLKFSLKSLVVLFCGGGIIVAWSHLTTVFQAQVFGLARLMGSLAQASETQKPLLLNTLQTEMSLQWLLTAIPFWSLALFSALALVILIWKEERS
jgi:disulfide bond formation protein DsbB